jgi:hypothetical protein
MNPYLGRNTTLTFTFYHLPTALNRAVPLLDRIQLRDISVVSKPRNQMSADCKESRLNHGDREQPRRGDLDRELSRVDLQVRASDDSTARPDYLWHPRLLLFHNWRRVRSWILLLLFEVPLRVGQSRTTPPTTPSSQNASRSCSNDPAEVVS